MYFTQDKITEIFVLADEFCKEFEKTMSNYTIGNAPKKKPKMSTSEVICIMIIFHGMNQKTMKNFYLNFVQKYLKDLFPQTVSYNRFVELMQQSALPLSMFLKLCFLGE